MEAASWADDSNPLTALFRVAYADFRKALDEERRSAPPAPQVSAAAAEAAASRMALKLGDISLALRRHAQQEATPEAQNQAKRLLYAFAAVVDEALINERWPGMQAWGGQLLERALFKTQLAGERLCTAIAGVSKAPRNRANVELAELYLDCLNLGFLGKYRSDLYPRAELEALQRELFRFVYQREARLQDERYRLGELAGQNLIRSAAPRLSFADRFNWSIVPVAALLAVLLASSILWLVLRAAPARAIDEIHGTYGLAESGVVRA